MLLAGAAAAAFTLIISLLLRQGEGWLSFLEQNLVKKIGQKNTPGGLEVIG
jgi:hypothetical protein